MKKLYYLIDDHQVLTKVIEEIAKTRQSLLLTDAEIDNSKVKPNSVYFEILSDLICRGIEVSRYFYGSVENYICRKNAEPNVLWIYAGKLENYQRAIIIDDQKMFFKIGKQFAYSEASDLVSVFKKYIESCEFPV